MRRYVRERKTAMTGRETFVPQLKPALLAFLALLALLSKYNRVKCLNYVGTEGT